MTKFVNIRQMVCRYSKLERAFPEKIYLKIFTYDQGTFCYEGILRIIVGYVNKWIILWCTVCWDIYNDYWP